MDGITLQEMSDETVQQLQANYVRQPAFARTEGTATAYSITLDPTPTSLADGFGITIVPHIANEANPTLNINGLDEVALKDQKGDAYAAGKLQVGKPYTFRKIGADFLADSGSGATGNAIAGDIRAGKTATVDEGEITGMLPVRSGGTVVPSTVNQTKQKGIYDSDIVVQGSANLIAGNIKRGVNLFGINGTLDAVPVSYSSEQFNDIGIPAYSSVNLTTSRIKHITIIQIWLNLISEVRIGIYPIKSNTQYAFFNTSGYNPGIVGTKISETSFRLTSESSSYITQSHQVWGAI